MREALAERLLAEVMQWSPVDVVSERPVLQALASYKYDHYQQFSAGMHFIESLASWLNKFDVSDRPVAYSFVKDKLIFISEAEMRHLVGLTFPDFVRPILTNKVASNIGLPEHAVTRILNSYEFSQMKRKALFLGLSDGARMDLLRRVAGLSNEQVHATYQLSDDKAMDMAQQLRDDLGTPDERFETLFLIDDFSGSGDSILRFEDGHLKGKANKCLSTLLERNTTTQLLDLGSLEVYVVLYIATEDAVNQLERRIKECWPTGFPQCSIVPVYVMATDIKVTNHTAPDFDDLLHKYYDESIFDRHLEKGGPDAIHGYANCSLPLILAHNTPNNTVYLLWATKENLKTKALCPRVSRHWDDS